MADGRFYTRTAPMTLGTCLETFSLTLHGTPDTAVLERSIKDVAGFDSAGPDDLIYLSEKSYLDRALNSEAGFCLTTPVLASVITEREGAIQSPAPILLLSEAPAADFARIADAFYASLSEARHGIHPSAFVDPSALLEADVEVGPGAVIEAKAEIGSGTVIGANAIIGAGVSLGRHCLVGPGASVRFAHVGNRVRIHAQCAVGEDGFGYVGSASGHLKIPQLGRVIIQDDVEIGAGSTIDRGALGDTIIGEGTKIDNLVQIAHNCVIGRHCVLAGQVGLAGSTILDDFVLMGGQAATAGHLRIGPGARLAARGAASRDLKGGETYAGAPARPLSQWRKEVAILSRLAKRPKGS